METVAASCAEKMTYGFNPCYGWVPDYQAQTIQFGGTNTSFKFTTPWASVQFDSPLIGWFNVPNLLAASCAALARGLTLDEITSAVRTLRQVPGRFQIVSGSPQAGFSVVVDYAHTPDALYELVASARNLLKTDGARVITLFGCGGDRDRTKRPMMGRAAGKESDLVVLTSDNPRSEDPAAILAEALAGVRDTGVEYVVEEDRARAIGVAIAAAKRGDIVLIAGKGHEKVQILRDGAVPFDDVAVAAAVLQRLTTDGHR